MQENRRSKNSLGTTKKGIGPTYSAKVRLFGTTCWLCSVMLPHYEISFDILFRHLDLEYEFVIWLGTLDTSEKGQLQHLVVLECTTQIVDS